MKSFVLAVLLLTYVVSVFALRIDPDVPWDCPENEEYVKCSLERCYTECKDLKVVKPCASVSADCYAPACLCANDMLRNDEGVCVPTDQCE